MYEKGAEVVRLYSTLLGKQGFRKGGCCPLHDDICHSKKLSL